MVKAEFEEGDVYKCKGHFGYCEEQGRCNFPTCPNYGKFNARKEEGQKDG